MLFIVYTFNYLDRQIISILAVPIQKELELTDTQLGLMGGFAFALFYSALGIPIARFADRLNRSWIIAGSLTLWSTFTALCGLATGFWQLFLARLGVGVGEAGGVAPSFSMISDYFPQSQRARALAAFTLALPVGTAAGLYIGGQLAVEYGWRTAFLVLGLTGVLIAPFFLLIVREPERGRYDPKRLATDTGQASFKDVCKVVLPKASFWYLSLGSGVASMLSYGLAFWLPAYVQRSLELDLSDTSKFLASAALIGGTLGILLGGLFGDHLGKKDRGAYGRIPAIAFMIAMPLILWAMVKCIHITVAYLPEVHNANSTVMCPQHQRHTQNPNPHELNPPDPNRYPHDPGAFPCDRIRRMRHPGGAHRPLPMSRMMTRCTRPPTAFPPASACHCTGWQTGPAPLQPTPPGSGYRDYAR